MKRIEDLTNLFKISKTLRFELKPIGKTLVNMNDSKIFEKDEHRAESYKKVKKIIDRYHKHFISSVLSNFAFQVNKDSSATKNISLEEVVEQYLIKNKKETDKNNLTKAYANLRSQIASAFKKDERFKYLNKKELITQLLPNILTDKEELKLVNEFNKFTTYFEDFHKNRMNMYVMEEKSTAIAYRIINENLPKFIDNIEIFKKIKESPVFNELPTLYDDTQNHLSVNSISELFELPYFNKVLAQEQIEVYNMIIGGKSIDDRHRIQGINELVNLYNQKCSNNNDKLPKLKLLYKQILSDREQMSFLPEEFENDQEVLDSINEYLNEDFFKMLFHNANNNLEDLLSQIDQYDTSLIYIKNDQQLTSISQSLFKAWDYIQNAILNDYELNNPKKPRTSAQRYDEEKEKYFKSSDSFSIKYLNDCIAKTNKAETIEYYFKKETSSKNNKTCTITLFDQLKEDYNNAKELLSNREYSKNLSQEKKDVALIKTLLDSIKRIQLFIKPLMGNGDEGSKDQRFYSELDWIWDTLDQLTPLYNKVRNRMTRKPYSNEKIKINFENANLLSGWDVNKEKDNTCVILRKDNLYYLAIMDKKHNNVFDAKMPSDGECYEKMYYKLLPGANKMLPKVFFSKSRINEFKPSQELLDNYNKKTHKKGDNFNLSDCHKLIDFFKSSIEKHEDWRQFNFKFSDTQTYQDLSYFYREVEHQGYKLTFSPISKSYIDKLVDEGKIYLFQIYNKDFSKYSKGKKNLHTLYWEALFDPDNLKDVVYKLNGEAEVFFRKKSIRKENIIKHPKNQPVNNKNPLNPKRTSTFEYDLIKDRRYTIDKLHLHIPITINFKAPDNANVNMEVNQIIRSNGFDHIIGIDRGERHLLYLTMIDLKGNIVKQYSLNQIISEYTIMTSNGAKPVECHTNYHDLLDEKENNRTEARKSWNTISNIKELKEGYLSQVVHIISKLIVEYNAIVVLEDLNFGFKRGRQKVEKAVYQKFEKMLIDKLNYLVFKDEKHSNSGGILNAYQLTNKFESFKQIGKQSGVLFYIPAWNTSKIDPTTGFVNLLDTRYYSIEKSKDFFNRFDQIRFNKEQGYYEFHLDYNKFTTKADGSRSRWTICSVGTRIRTFRNPQKNNEWDNQEVKLTEELTKFFEKNNIDYQSNLKEQIVNLNSASAFKELHYLLSLLLQMRNSAIGSEIDYLLSPVADKNGHFFDSREGNCKLPLNADANGAFNIARKGLWIMQQIKNTDDIMKFKIQPIKNKEWLHYAQQQPYREE